MNAISVPRFITFVLSRLMTGSAMRTMKWTPTDKETQIYFLTTTSIFFIDIRLIVQVGRVFANCLRDLGSIPGYVIPKTLKMVLDTSLLNTQHYKVRSRVKWVNPRNWIAPSPTPLCNSYWKRSLLFALDYGRQLYLLLYGIYTIPSVFS